MIRDNNSDTQDYRPSLPDNILANYWSEDDICHSRVEEFQLNWAASIMQKDDIKDEAEISGDKLSQEETPASSPKKKKSVTIDENNNSNISISAFSFGSNQSPSLLGVENAVITEDQNNENDITGKKRSIDENIDQTPPKKRQRMSNLNSNVNSKKRSLNNNNSNVSNLSLNTNTNDNVDIDINTDTQNQMSYEQLQSIQNEAQIAFQNQMIEEGIVPHGDFMSSFQRSFGLNQHANQGSKSQKRNSNQNNNNANNRNTRTNRRNNRSNSARQSGRNVAGAGGGGDSSDDGDDEDDRKYNDDSNINRIDHSESEVDSDDSDANAAKGITISPPSQDLQNLHSQNDTLNRQLNDSNKKIAELMGALPSSNNNNSDSNAGVQMQVFQQMLKQHQLQMQHLMR